MPFFPDLTIWEGMVSNTLIGLAQMTSILCGLAAASIAFDLWTAHRLGTRGKKNEL